MPIDLDHSSGEQDWIKRGRVVPSRVLVAGFDATHARVTAADSTTDEAFHAIIEALAWIGVLRDRMKQEKRPIPETLYGLYFVRNLALHAGADVLAWISSTYGSGTYGSGAYGGQGRVWQWPAYDELPRPQSNTGLSDYKKHVAGHDVADVLAAVSNEISQLR